MVESINNVNKLHVQQQNNSKKNGAIDAKKQPISFNTGEKSGAADGKGVILERSLNDNKATGFADGVAGAFAGVAGGAAGGVSNKKDENGCIELKPNIVEKKKYEYKDFMPMPNKSTKKDLGKYKELNPIPKKSTKKESKKYEDFKLL